MRAASCHAGIALIGVSVRTLRTRRALSQDDLAKKAGVDAATIYRIEAGHTKPRPSTVRRLADALGVPPEALTGVEQHQCRVNTTMQSISDSTTSRPRRHLNDLTGAQWVRETISVWTQRGLGKNHPHTAIERQHPAPFSYQDIARVIQFFTKSGETILDPFVGVGSSLKAAALTGRNGIGIELNERYASLAKQRLIEEVPSKSLQETSQQVILGDARMVLPTLVGLEASLVVTSPPYWNILHKVDHKASQERIEQNLDYYYSDSPKDLGNIPDYEMFVNELADCLQQAKSAMTPRGHLCVVVGDFRHKARYYMFHADLSRRMQERGFTTKGVIVLHQPRKRVFPYGYPTAFVPNVHHQYILICQRDDSY